MHAIQLSNRYAIPHASPAGGEGQPPLQPGAPDMPWPDIEEPGRLAAPQGEAVAPGVLGEPAEPGEAGDVNNVVMLHPQPQQGEAHVVDIEGQVNPDFMAAVVAIQDELDHPALPVAPLQVQAPQVPPMRSRCDTESVLGCGAVTLTLGAVTSAIAGGVLFFTADDPESRGDGFIALCAGVTAIAGWCCVSLCSSD